MLMSHGINVILGHGSLSPSTGLILPGSWLTRTLGIASGLVFLYLHQALPGIILQGKVPHSDLPYFFALPWSNQAQPSSCARVLSTLVSLLASGASTSVLNKDLKGELWACVAPNK